MGKVKRSYKNVDRSAETQQYSGDVPKPGIYDFYLKKVDDHEGGDAAGNKLVWMFECTQEPYSGWAGWVYTNDDSTAWKEVQIFEALGLLGPDDDSVDLTHEQIVAKAGPVRCKLINETYEDEKRAKIRTVLPPRDGQSKPSSNGKAASKGKKKKKDGDTPF
jgi:hypothetical protein